MTSRPRRAPLGYGALDFITGVAVIFFVSGIITRHVLTLATTALAWAAIMAVASLFGVLPEGYFTHLFRRAQLPKS